MFDLRQRLEGKRDNAIREHNFNREWPKVLVCCHPQSVLHFNHHPPTTSEFLNGAKELS
jgi:hypothetical protein